MATTNNRAKMLEMMQAAQQKATTKDAAIKAKFATPQQPTTPTPATDANGVKVYDNLQDISTAAKAGEVISITNLSQLVNKKPTPQATPQPQTTGPELGTLTTADLIGNPAATHGATIEAAAVAAFTTPAKSADQEAAGPLRIENYSEKAFAVYGETKPFRLELKKYGKFNYNLKGGPGWIFSKKREAEIRTLLNL